MPYSPARTAFSRISQLASLRPVHEAFQWLHLHQPHILEWQTEMVGVPRHLLRKARGRSGFWSDFAPSASPILISTN